MIVKNGLYLFGDVCFESVRRAQCINSSEGRGDTKRVRGSEGGPKARRGGWIVRQPLSGRQGQRRGVKDKHRGARSGASRRGGERGSGRGVRHILQRETEEKVRQPETKLGATAHTRHLARLRNARRSRTKIVKCTVSKYPTYRYAKPPMATSL
jgi:hypothetical protein